MNRLVVTINEHTGAYTADDNGRAVVFVGIAAARLFARERGYNGIELSPPGLKAIAHSVFERMRYREPLCSR